MHAANDIFQLWRHACRLSQGICTATLVHSRVFKMLAMDRYKCVGDKVTGPSSNLLGTVHSPSFHVECLTFLSEGSHV